MRPKPNIGAMPDDKLPPVVHAVHAVASRPGRAAEIQEAIERMQRDSSANSGMVDHSVVLKQQLAMLATVTDAVAIDELTLAIRSTAAAVKWGAATAATTARPTSAAAAQSRPDCPAATDPPQQGTTDEPAANDRKKSMVAIDVNQPEKRKIWMDIAASAISRHHTNSKPGWTTSISSTDPPFFGSKFLSATNSDVSIALEDMQKDDDELCAVHSQFEATKATLSEEVQMEKTVQLYKRWSGLYIKWSEWLAAIQLQDHEAELVTSALDAVDLKMRPTAANKLAFPRIADTATEPGGKDREATAGPVRGRPVGQPEAAPPSAAVPNYNLQVGKQLVATHIGNARRYLAAAPRQPGYSNLHAIAYGEAAHELAKELRAFAMRLDKRRQELEVAAASSGDPNMLRSLVATQPADQIDMKKKQKHLNILNTKAGQEAQRNIALQSMQREQREKREASGANVDVRSGVGSTPSTFGHAHRAAQLLGSPPPVSAWAEKAAPAHRTASSHNETTMTQQVYGNQQPNVNLLPGQSQEVPAYDKGRLLAARDAASRFANYTFGVNEGQHQQQQQLHQQVQDLQLRQQQQRQQQMIMQQQQQQQQGVQQDQVHRPYSQPGLEPSQIAPTMRSDLRHGAPSKESYGCPIRGCDVWCENIHTLAVHVQKAHNGQRIDGARIKRRMQDEPGTQSQNQQHRIRGVPHQQRPAKCTNALITNPILTPSSEEACSARRKERLAEVGTPRSLGALHTHQRAFFDNRVYLYTHTCSPADFVNMSAFSVLADPLPSKKKASKKPQKQAAAAAAAAATAHLIAEANRAAAVAGDAATTAAAAAVDAAADAAAARSAEQDEFTIVDDDTIQVNVDIQGKRLIADLSDDEAPFQSGVRVAAALPKPTGRRKETAGRQRKDGAGSGISHKSRAYQEERAASAAMASKRTIAAAYQRNASTLSTAGGGRAINGTASYRRPVTYKRALTAYEKAEAEAVAQAAAKAADDAEVARALAQEEVERLAYVASFVSAVWVHACSG
jgi:hypothetical protein